MLSIRAAKGPDYYERPEFAADDYYVEDGRAPGRWAGRGAEALGLAGEPDDGDLAALLSGHDPASGAELAGGRGRRPSNVAFDLTFAAPKTSHGRKGQAAAGRAASRSGRQAISSR